MNSKTPVILITNDDGITAPGIKALVEAVKDLGHVVVVAPDSPQSGMGHAITIGSPLRLNKIAMFDGVESWQGSGTPADCVKLAKAKIPLITVCGDVDTVVPIDENTYKLAAVYTAAGGEIELIIKKGVGHHPHSLKDPIPIVDFILKNTMN
jgi:alpha-beta hydrolase superfamily lysophospholipase